MIRNAYLSASKLLILLVLGFATNTVQAQYGSRYTGSNLGEFLKTQWWLGLRVGMNYAEPSPGTRYSSIDPIDYELEDLNKTYESFNLPGVLMGLDVTFYHKGFSIGVQPSFKQMHYSFMSEFAWEGATDAERFETMYETKQSLSYIELPVTLKYELIKRGKVRPFVMAGMHYSYLADAEKETNITNTDYMSGAPRAFDGGSVNLKVKNQFQDYYGAFAGLGTGFDYLNIRTVLEITYMYGLSPVSNSNRRYDADELTSLGELNDEVNLNNINVSLSFVFPLRYIDNTFQPY